MLSFSNELHYQDFQSQELVLGSIQILLGQAFERTDCSANTRVNKACRQSPVTRLWRYPSDTSLKASFRGFVCPALQTEIDLYDSMQWAAMQIRDQKLCKATERREGEGGGGGGVWETAYITLQKMQ